MVSQTSSASAQAADQVLFSATTPSASTDSSDAFAQQLVSALESYLGQSGSGSQLELNIQPNQGQESGSGQYLVTLTAAAPVSAATASASVADTASAALASDSTSSSASSATAPTFSGPSLSSIMQGVATDWSVLTPQQTAFQLANGGAGGGDPTTVVPGTSMAWGQLNQAQQVAYQYSEDSGTGGLSTQDFLTQNAGPQAVWNESYDQIQQNPAIMAAVDPAEQVSAGEVPMPIQAPDEYGTPPALSGNADNLPNPALIQYLPPDQQAAAEAAVAAEGVYGQNMAAAATAYDAPN